MYKSLGFIAWLLQRITGLGLAFYLFLHIYVMNNLPNKIKFDEVMRFLQQPIFKLLEISLLFAIVYHSLNGLRILIVDIAYGSRQHKILFWVLIGFGIIIFIAGSIPLLPKF